MKKIALLFGAISITLFGCDVIEFPVIDFGASYDAGTYGPPPTFDLASDDMIQQTVIIEDFTGHDCGNCPRAAIVAEDLKAANPEQVFVLAIHAGNLAAPTDEYPEDFTNEAGEVWFDQLDLPFNPVGRVNRFPDWNTSVFDPEWPELVDEQLDMAPIAVLQLQAEYHSNNNELNVHAFTEFVADYEGNTNVVLIVTESGLVGTQLNYLLEDDPETVENEQKVEDYEFEHVMRDVVNTTFGLTAINAPKSGDTNTQSYTYSWNSEWAIDHSSVIAICFDADTGQVLGVTEKKLDA